jgi:Planctomycete cytochrome C
MRGIKKQSNGGPSLKCFSSVTLFASRFTSYVSLGCFTFCFSLPAAETNSAPLPPPATTNIVFDRDIRPILETSCLRCHGGAKPKSHFRLDDRAAALDGGDDSTEDIVPGHSDRSDLIRYVAGLDKDIHMPPSGKGPPLTPRQLSLLRAWIDEGVNWQTTNQPTQLAFTFAPTLRWIDVQGDKAKFRELQGVNDGFSGGAEEFSFIQQTSPTEKFSLSGHVIAPDRDIKLKLAVDEADQGFIHAGFDEWRKYYDDSGGYDPAVVPPELRLNRDLYVDNGRFWIDLGLTPPRWPQIVLGYEYDFKKGTEAALDWGEAGGVNIAPSTKAIDEQTHILKLDLTHDFNDWHLEDNARVEFYSENNRSYETDVFQQGGGTTSGTTYTPDSYHHVQGMNTLMVQKQIRDWWFLSGGYYYSKLDGSDFFGQTNSPAFNPLVAEPSSWSSGGITLRRESEIFSVASLFLPLNYLSFSLGSQNEWTRQEGFGDSVPDFEFGNNTSALGDYDEFKATQNADLRFTKIPFTVLFAEARFEEGSIGEFQQEGAGQFTNRTDVTSDRYHLRAGFNTSPWRWVELNAEYRRQYSDSDYNHLIDFFNDPNNFGFAAPLNGYPAFILNRKIQTDEIETKLTLHPVNWLRTTLSYKLTATEYSSKTDTNALSVLIGSPAGGPVADGRYRAQTYGITTTLTPFRQLYFSGAFTYSHSLAVTAANGDASIVPYRGDVYTFISTAAYALNAKTGLQASYSFSYAGYGQNNAPNGVPLGLDFTRHVLFVGLTRQFTKNLSGALHYEFSQYSEPSSAHLNDFTAHGVFATLMYRWP